MTNQSALSLTLFAIFVSMFVGFVRTSRDLGTGFYIHMIAGTASAASLALSLLHLLAPAASGTALERGMLLYVAGAAGALASGGTYGDWRSLWSLKSLYLLTATSAVMLALYLPVAQGR